MGLAGDEVEYTSGTPEDVDKIRQAMIASVLGGILMPEAGGGGSGIDPNKITQGLNLNRGGAVNQLRSRMNFANPGYSWEDPASEFKTTDDKNIGYNWGKGIWRPR